MTTLERIEKLNEGHGDDPWDANRPNYQKRWVGPNGVSTSALLTAR